MYLTYGRLNVPEWQVKSLSERLEVIKGVQCSLYKQSLYVWCDKLKEEEEW